MAWWKKYALDAPYPTIKVAKPNLFYASLLQDDYSGYVSEFTAVAQYMYHHYYFDRVDEKLAEIVEGIAIVEMHHLEMLAHVIIQLGGDPRYGGMQSTNCQYWSGAFPGYGHSLCERLQLDINAERDAIWTYRYHAQLIDAMDIRALLERIILDEQYHLKLFQEQYDRFCQCKCKSAKKEP